MQPLGLVHRQKLRAVRGQAGDHHAVFVQRPVEVHVRFPDHGKPDGPNLPLAERVQKVGRLPAVERNRMDVDHPGELDQEFRDRIKIHLPNHQPLARTLAARRDRDHRIDRGLPIALPRLFMADRHPKGMVRPTWVTMYEPGGHWVL